MSDVQVSPQDVFDRMPEALLPEKAATTKAMIQFDLSGDQGGKWWVKIHEGKAESGKGDAPEPPQLTLLADAADYVKISLGQLDGTAAFMSGKLKIKGDMGLAIKFATLFRRPGT
jgi:putative sterol carrier protein